MDIGFLQKPVNGLSNLGLLNKISFEYDVQYLKVEGKERWLVFVGSFCLIFFVQVFLCWNLLDIFVCSFC